MLDLLETADLAVVAAMEHQLQWGLVDSGAHRGQYHHDLTADEAVLAVLGAAGVSVLSEESGFANADVPAPGALGALWAASGVTVVVDPIDGSTNASRRLPWWSTSLCAVDADGPWVGLVHDHSTGQRWHAVRGGGAWYRPAGAVTAAPVRRSSTPDLGDAVISVAGWPPRHGGWAQFRAYGSLALELCAVADGRLDGIVQFVTDEVAAWDYLAGMLICQEAGAEIADAFGRSLVALGHADRRTPVGAGSRPLLDQLLALRNEA